MHRLIVSRTLGIAMRDRVSAEEALASATGIEKHAAEAVRIGRHALWPASATELRSLASSKPAAAMRFRRKTPTAEWHRPSPRSRHFDA